MPKSELVPTKGIYNLSHSRTVSSDFKIQATKQIKELPKFVDLSSQCSPITNQSSLGSCGSHAIVSGLREFLLLKTNSDATRLSRLFHYYMARRQEGTINEDSGMTIRVGMQVIQEYGSCTEQRDPYIIKDFKVAPSPEEIEEAKKYRLPSTFALRNILELKNSIANGYPVVIGMEVFPYMESQEMAKKGVLQIPANSEQALGGHALCCLPGTTITTKDGFLPIEDVEVGDEVLTHTGKFRRVLSLSSREIDEEVYTIQNNCGENLCVTGDHPIFTKKYSVQTKLVQTKRTNSFEKNIGWTKAEELRHGNLLYSPIYDEVTVDDDVIYEKEFFELLGMYVGDGNVAVRYSKNSNVKSAKLRFSFGKDYPELIDRCKELLKKYSLNSVGIDNFDKHINLVCYDTKLALKVGGICGVAHQKNIPYSILTAPTFFQKFFVAGWYQTDGCKTPTGVSISTSEESLKDQLLFMLKRLRLLFSVTKRKARSTIIKGKTINCRPNYMVYLHNTNEELEQVRTNHKSIYSDSYLVSKISSISKEPYQGKVYNFEVEEDNSYVANGVAVHNCVTGYKETKDYKGGGFLIVRNSWGPNWGLKGYFKMPYEYVRRGFVFDFWTGRM